MDMPRVMRVEQLLTELTRIVAGVVLVLNVGPETSGSHWGLVSEGLQLNDCLIVRNQTHANTVH